MTRSSAATTPASVPKPLSTRAGELREALLAWYRANRRDLPWRAGEGEPADPYRVWLSEVMLQQTRVETVVRFYERWLERFPTLAALADAPLDDVLKAWEGLGYYSRARNFHSAVREVRARYGGDVPDDPEAFGALPGVGRYTEGAVMSIAFGQAAPIVDGNVRRVFARWTDDPDPPAASLWAMAARLAPGSAPGELNQALMELGATVCTPRKPRCGVCPARELCQAPPASPERRRSARADRRRIRSPTRHGRRGGERDGRLLLSAARWRRAWWDVGLPCAVRHRGESVADAAERAVREGLGLAIQPGPTSGRCATLHPRARHLPRRPLRLRRGRAAPAAL